MQLMTSDAMILGAYYPCKIFTRDRKKVTNFLQMDSILSKRWIVKEPFAWLGRFHRLANNLTSYVVATIQLILRQQIK